MVLSLLNIEKHTSAVFFSIEIATYISTRNVLVLFSCARDGYERVSGYHLVWETGGRLVYIVSSI